MLHTHDSRSVSCPADCSGCAPGDAPADRSALRGGRLALAAMGVFLVPLGLSIAGATLLSGSPVRTFAGAVGGLLAGATLAGIVARRLRRRRETTA